MDKVKQYAEANILPKRDTFEFLTENIEYLNFSPGDVVLDIGCGPGNVTANILLPKLPNNIGHLVGGDLSEDMVQHATDNFAHPKLSFTQLDIATKTLDLLKLRSLVDSKQSDDSEHTGIFDKIFSFYCLNWVEEQKQALKNIYDLLKPGGEGLVLLVAIFPVYNLYEIMARKTRWQPYMKDASHVESPYRHSPDAAQEFEGLLQEQGFEVIRCRTETRSFQFETMKPLKEMMISINQFGVRIPNDLLEEFVNDSIMEISNGKIARMIYSNNSTREGDGTVEMTYSVITAHFKKPLPP